MATLADVIEAYLLALLAREGRLEVQRAELAARFGCAPSQINYVLVTRFTPARGFTVQSRRGGGGFIRLARLPAPAAEAVSRLPDELDQAGAEHHLDRMAAAGILTRREAAMLRAAIQREVLDLPLPLRDRIRAAVLRAAVCAVARAPAGEAADGDGAGVRAGERGATAGGTRRLRAADGGVGSP